MDEKLKQRPYQTKCDKSRIKEQAALLPGEASYKMSHENESTSFNTRDKNSPEAIPSSLKDSSLGHIGREITCPKQLFAIGGMPAEEKSCDNGESMIVANSIAKVECKVRGCQWTLGSKRK